MTTPKVVPASDRIRECFLETASVVRDAIGSAEVDRDWDGPSVLEFQTVGGLAGHLARGGVWVVGDYLDGDTPVGPVTVESAAAYYAHLMERVTEADHAEIRQRGADLSRMGQLGLVATLDERLAALHDRLRAEPADRLVAVAGGSVVMGLDDYLVTRLVEQVVHLDDLARSVGLDGFGRLTEATELVLAVGLDIGRRRFGAAAMLRALYRSTGGPGPLPVL